MRNSLDKIRNNSGITLIELFVALFLVSILMVFIISANLFVQKFISDWEDNNTIYTDGDFIISNIISDLKKSYGFTEIDSLSYGLVVSFSDTIKYQLKEGNIQRNGHTLNMASIQCLELNLIENGFEKTTPDSILVNGKYKYTDKLVSVKLRLLYKKTEELFESSMRIKNANQIY